MKKRALYHSFTIIILLTSYLSGTNALSARNQIRVLSDTSCFYINLNQLYQYKILEIQKSTVCFEYEDLYGKDADLSLAFYNWQRKIIASIKVPKQYGKNAYSLNLEQLGLPFNNEDFTLEVTSENDKKTEIILKLVPAPNKAAPLVNIFVSPIALQCGSDIGNLIEYYGQIEGGKAPYEVEWTVMDVAQTSLLYQPRKEKVSEQGSTPIIQVDQSPAYYVQLQVTDACGNKGKQIVSIQCQEKIENPNSILFQPVPNLPSTPNILKTKGKEL